MNVYVIVFGQNFSYSTVSSATAEKRCSTTRRVKIHNWTTMTERRLRNLPVLSCCRSKVKKNWIDLDDIEIELAWREVEKISITIPVIKMILYFITISHILIIRGRFTRSPGMIKIISGSAPEPNAITRRTSILIAFNRRWNHGNDFCLETMTVFRLP